MQGQARRLLLLLLLVGTTCLIYWQLLLALAALLLLLLRRSLQHLQVRQVVQQPAPMALQQLLLLGVVGVGWGVLGMTVNLLVAPPRQQARQQGNHTTMSLACASRRPHQHQQQQLVPHRLATPRSSCRCRLLLLLVQQGCLPRLWCS